MLSKNLLEINTLKILTCIGFADAGFLKNDDYVPQKSRK
jgi:hypothetical protein